MSLLNSLMGENNVMTDESITNDMMMAGKAAANMYLNAALISTTPELKSMYAASLSQILEGEAAASALAVDHRWAKPYEKPEQQLADAYKASVSVIDYRK